MLEYLDDDIRGNLIKLYECINVSVLVSAIFRLTNYPTERLKNMILTQISWQAVTYNCFNVYFNTTEIN